MTLGEYCDAHSKPVVYNTNTSISSPSEVIKVKEISKFKWLVLQR